jgi:hypothetical protein
MNTAHSVFGDDAIASDALLILTGSAMHAVARPKLWPAGQQFFCIALGCWSVAPLLHWWYGKQLDRRSFYL